MNKLARAVTKWTHTCDRRLARLTSHIHHTNDYRQFCHVGNTAQHCRLGLFQDSDFAGDLEDSKSTSGGVFCIFGRVSDNKPMGQQETVREIKKPKPKQKGNRDVDQLSHVDYVTTDANSSQGESELYIFENNEAVIKMIIKGRSPTMRHVSRTHRVALDWLFDRINLEPKIQIIYGDTKNQLADILTKGSFSKNEWNRLLCLFNIMSFSMYSYSHFQKLSLSG